MNEYKMIQAGFGKADITPLGPVYLGGFQNGMERRSTFQKQNDPFHALTLALTDDKGQTLLFISTDLKLGHIDLANKLRQLVKERFQIPGEYVFLSGTDNCSGPEYVGDAANTPENKAYFEHWFAGVMHSVEQALADRSSAQIRIGTTATKNVAFVRRYLRQDGNFLGHGDAAWYVKSSSPIVRHESDADEQIQLVRLVRDGFKDILIGQWQNKGCHLSGAYYGTSLCATDWIGPLRRKVEKETGCHFFYMQGCGANLAGASKINGEMHFDNKRPTEDHLAYLTAEPIIRAWYTSDFFRPVNGGEIRVKHQTYVENEKDWQAELNTVAIGDISVATLPVEMFDASGMQIKSATPFDMTLLMGYTNGIDGYCPNEEAFANGGFETQSIGIRGTAERIVRAQLTALQSLHG